MSSYICMGEAIDRESHQEKLQKYIASLKADALDEATYKELCMLIPDTFLVERDRELSNPIGCDFQRKTSKRKLNKETDKAIIDQLKQFAMEKKLNAWNQLAFNDHFEDIYIRTIYLIIKP